LKSEQYNPPNIIDRISDLILSDKFTSNDEEEFGAILFDNHEKVKLLENICHSSKGIKFEPFLTYLRLLIGSYYATKWLKEITNEYNSIDDDNMIKKFSNIETQNIDDPSNMIAVIKRKKPVKDYWSVEDDSTWSQILLSILYNLKLPKSEKLTYGRLQNCFILEFILFSLKNFG